MSGRISYYGGIVNNGLILALDAAKKDSYPGTGTLWTDISGFRNNGTLTNGPTFSSLSGSTFVFDGVNDYVDTPYTTPIGTNNFTYCIWARFTVSQLGGLIIKRISTNFQQFSLFIAGDANGNSSGGRIAFNDFNSGGRINITPNNYNDGLWHYIVCTRNSVGTYLYVDGVIRTQALSAIPNLSANGKLFIGCSSSDGLNPSGLYFNGSIAYVQLYNRNLTDIEVLQNFNATRGRFGV